jgi:nitrite reductase/ring-hydroxylating ferredoxin subunit
MIQNTIATAPTSRLFMYEQQCVHNERETAKKGKVESEALCYGHTALISVTRYTQLTDDEMVD